MQDAKISCRNVSSAWLISWRSEISLFFCLDQSWLGRRVKFSAFYMVRILKEWVSWCLRSRDLTNAFPNMKKGYQCLEGFYNIKNNIWVLPLDPGMLFSASILWLVCCENESASVMVTSLCYWLSTYSRKFSMHEWIKVIVICQNIAIFWHLPKFFHLMD